MESETKVELTQSATIGKDVCSQDFADMLHRVIRKGNADSFDGESVDKSELESLIKPDSVVVLLWTTPKGKEKRAALTGAQVLESLGNQAGVFEEQRKAEEIQKTAARVGKIQFARSTKSARVYTKDTVFAPK